MKNNIKNAVIILLVTILAFTYLTLPTNASTIEKDIFVIGGKCYDNITQDLNGEGWSWDASEFKLTLNGYNSSYIIFFPATNTSKTLNIVLNSTNNIVYNKNELLCPINDSNNCSNLPDSFKCFLCSKTNDNITALYVMNCGVNLSGGTLNITATGDHANAIYLSNNSTIQNTTLNCNATYISITSSGHLTIEKSTIIMDSQRGYSAKLYCDGCKLTYKNTKSNGEHRELISSGGEHIFKNCTFDIITGARPLDNEKLYFSGFQGIARYEFDNTVLKVKQGTHNNPNNSYVLFNLGYPEMDNNYLTIKNNSKFEIDKCIQNVFSAQQINISNSAVTGVCNRNFISTTKLNITNSNIDFIGNGNSTDVFIEANEMNIKNSKVKFQTNGYLWVPNQDFDFPNEKKLSLVDSQVDFSGKIDKFGEKWSLKYDQPEKWIVMLDGVKSNLSVNSEKLDIRHKKLTIKIDENYKPNQSGTSSTPIAQNNSNPNESTNKTENSSSIVDNNPVDTENQTKNQQSSLEATGDLTPEEQPKNWWIWIIIVALVMGGGATAAFFIFKNKIK